MTTQLLHTAETTAPRRATTGWVLSLREAIAARRARQTVLSRQIAAYPATRSASVTVVPRPAAESSALPSVR